MTHPVGLGGMEAGLGGDEEQQLGKDQRGKGQGDRPQQPRGTGLTGNTITALLGSHNNFTGNPIMALLETPELPYWEPHTGLSGTPNVPYWDPTLALLVPHSPVTGMASVGRCCSCRGVSLGSRAGTASGTAHRWHLGTRTSDFGGPQLPPRETTQDIPAWIQPGRDPRPSQRPFCKKKPPRTSQ